MLVDPEKFKGSFGILTPDRGQRRLLRPTKSRNLDANGLKRCEPGVPEPGQLKASLSLVKKTEQMIV